MDGEVIGVNTAIISPTGGSIGIGFAVPSDTVVAVIDQLKQFGETRRGWLGVKIQTVTEDIAETLGVPENTGALVSAVTPDSPAAKGGLEAGDVIMKFDGKDVTTHARPAEDRGADADRQDRRCRGAAQGQPQDLPGDDRPASKTKRKTAASQESPEEDKPGTEPARTRRSSA